MMPAFIKRNLLLMLSPLLFLGSFFWLVNKEKAHAPILQVAAKPESFDVTVKTVGVLEARNSVVVYSSLKGDQGKIIDLVRDGSSVKKGDVLVRLDPTPFEQKLEEIEAKIREQHAALQSFKQNLAAEKDKADLEEQAAKYELENAEVERDKIVKGDGPMEEAKLKRALEKAKESYLELKAYEEDLDLLEKQGFLSQGEKRQAKKKLAEAKEVYDDAKLQYESFSQHVFPMQVKKAEVSLKRAMIKYEDTIKASLYKIAKAEHGMQQAILGMKYLERQKKDALRDLQLTEIKAPAPGMAVLREEFRSGEKRKPRAGDIALKNQPILNLPDLSRMIVKTKVREVDLHKIGLGLPASVEIDAYPGLHLLGKVVSIGILALSDFKTSGEKYFEVSILLDSEQEILRPGMTARVCINSCRVEDKIAVPVNAVFISEGEYFCYKKTPGGYNPFPVTLGASNESLVEIKSGIDSGDTVSLLPPDALP